MKAQGIERARRKQQRRLHRCLARGQHRQQEQRTCRSSKEGCVCSHTQTVQRVMSLIINAKDRQGEQTTSREETEKAFPIAGRKSIANRRQEDRSSRLVKSVPQLQGQSDQETRAAGYAASHGRDQRTVRGTTQAAEMQAQLHEVNSERDEDRQG